MKITAKTTYEITATTEENKIIGQALDLLDEWCNDDETKVAFNTTLPGMLGIEDIRDGLDRIYSLIG